MCCRLQRFCCCCSLKTGTLIIATAGWVFTLIKLFGIIQLATTTDTSSSNISIDGLDQEMNEYAKTQAANMHQVIANTFGVRIGYAVVSLLASLLLLWGVEKKNNKFMLPWLILECIEFITLSIVPLALFIIIFIVPGNIVGIMILLFLFFTCIAAFCWYTWICVWGHYMELKDLENGPNVYYSPTSNINTNPPPYDPKQPLA